MADLSGRPSKDGCNMAATSGAGRQRRARAQRAQAREVRRAEWRGDILSGDQRVLQRGNHHQQVMQPVFVSEQVVMAAAASASYVATALGADPATSARLVAEAVANVKMIMDASPQRDQPMTSTSVKCSGPLSPESSQGICEHELSPTRCPTSPVTTSSAGTPSSLPLRFDLAACDTDSNAGSDAVEASIMDLPSDPGRTDSPNNATVCNVISGYTCTGFTESREDVRANVRASMMCSHGPGSECILCKDYDALCRD